MRVGGVDEVGRGPWAGPVTAAVAVMDETRMPSSLLCLIQDSKKLSSATREFIFEALNKLPIEVFAFGIGHSSVEEIDHLNIREATFLAMRRAYEALPNESRPQILLIDGRDAPVLAEAVSSFAVVKGDQVSTSIAAASILAKVTRDRYMATLATVFPAYGWDSNAGYGTQAHQAALAEQGVTPHHRRSFAPIKRLLDEVA